MAATTRASRTHLRDRPSFLLSQLGFHSDDRFDDLLEPLGVTRRQFGLLRLLADAEGQTQQQLSERLRTHRNVMVGMIDELEGRGLVERRRYPTDRRAHAVHLTGTAKKLLARGETILDACDNELVSALDPTERTALVTLLQRVADRAGLIPDLHPGMTQPNP